jgi:hypothetical protein
MADHFFDRCNDVHVLKLSFTRRRSVAHKTLEPTQVMPYSLSLAATATGLTH